MAAIASTRRLIINADDLGLSRGINRGIAAAVTDGALRSASLMANGPAFGDALRVAAECGSTLGVGLHLNFTLGSPLTPSPSLTDSRTGAFLSRRHLLRRALMGRISVDDVEQEFTAQLRRMRDAGIAVTHLDGHHHVHVFPRIARVIADCARREGISFVRRPDEATMATWRPWRRLPTRLVLARWSRNGSLGSARHADHFRGLTLFDSPEVARGLLALLDSLTPGITELMMHPGFADDDPMTGDSYGRAREVELSALRSAVRRAALARRGITLTHFGEL